MQHNYQEQIQSLITVVFKLINVTSDITAELYCLNESNDADMREIVKQKFNLQDDHLELLKQRFMHLDETMLEMIKSFADIFQPKEFEMLMQCIKQLCHDKSCGKFLMNNKEKCEFDFIHMRIIKRVFFEEFYIDFDQYDKISVVENDSIESIEDTDESESSEHSDQSEQFEEIDTSNMFND